jgi:hypothetical protein
MWVKLSLKLKQEKNTVDADLDIKIEKNLSLGDFENLL